MAKQNIQNVKLDAIRVDGGTQQRAQIDQEHVAALAEHLKDHPPGLAFDDGEEIWLSDGHHRYHSRVLAGAKTMPLVLRKGTRRDAILASLGANAEHNALRRTNADKRHAVETALADPEWSKLSNRKIAEMCAVSPGMVDQVRGPKVPTVGSADDQKPHSEPENAVSDESSETNTTAANSSVLRPAQGSRAGDHNGDGDDDPQPPKTPAAAANPVPFDQEGHPLPDRIAIREAFRVVGEFDGLMTAISQVKGRAGEIVEVAAVYLDRQQLTAHLNNARSELNDARPHAVCPYCAGTGREGRTNECRACRGCGWVKRRTWESAPEDMKAKLRKGAAA